MSTLIHVSWLDGTVPRQYRFLSRASVYWPVPDQPACESAWLHNRRLGTWGPHAAGKRGIAVLTLPGGMSNCDAQSTMCTRGLSWAAQTKSGGGWRDGSWSDTASGRRQILTCTTTSTTTTAEYGSMRIRQDVNRAFQAGKSKTE
jgi:hypothetical protein